jgi:hypothetical protein
MITHENVSFVKSTGIKLELPLVSFCKVESSDNDRHLMEKVRIWPGFSMGDCIWLVKFDLKSYIFF